MLIVVLLLFPLTAVAGEKISGTNFFVVDGQEWQTGDGSGYFQVTRTRSNATALDSGTRKGLGAKAYVWRLLAKIPSQAIGKKKRAKTLASGIS
jgi:hypothetical protein